VLPPDWVTPSVAQSTSVLGKRRPPTPVRLETVALETSRGDLVTPWFLRDSPGFQITPELKPRQSEAIFDKLTMSALGLSRCIRAGHRGGRRHHHRRGQHSWLRRRRRFHRCRSVLQGVAAPGWMNDFTQSKALHSRSRCATAASRRWPSSASRRKLGSSRRQDTPPTLVSSRSLSRTPAAAGVL
jgi:hypothetical protein